MSEIITCPKCGHVHQPPQSRHADSWPMKCDECGFEYEVQVFYQPHYSTHCIEHEFGPVQLVQLINNMAEVRFCVRCYQCDAKMIALRSSEAE